MPRSDIPKDFAALKARIAERAQSMPKRLTQVAAYALEFPDEIAFGTVASIAQNADVQPSTLVRFSQSLGYQGFSDLQDIFRSRLRDRVLNYEERIEQLREHGHTSSKSTVIFDGFSEAAMKSIADLREKIDSATLDEVVTKLAKAETVFLIGLRRSFPIASYMAYAFGKLGVKTMLVDAVGGLAVEDVSFATNKDCVLAISFNPYASETISLVQKAVARKVPVVAITDGPFSPLATLANPWIEVQESNFEGFRSMAATMALAMTITVAVAGKRSKNR
jgi:DNA-binding MurR/RpiR family transcriptional regulator